MSTEDKTPPAPGTTEYNEAMLARRAAAREDQNPADPTASPEATPAAEEAPKVPEKFLNADGSVNTEALLKSYTELEKSRGASAPATPDPDAKVEKLEITPEAEKAVVTDAGLDYEALTVKAMSEGGLSEADYKSLSDRGIPKDLVDDVINMRRQQAEMVKQAAFDYVGGEAQAAELLQWASQNLTAEEIDGYNTMLAGPSWKVAFDTLQSKRGAANPKAQEPKLRTLTSAPAAGSEGFQTKEDMKVAMADPKYRAPGSAGDAYRAEVARKMAAAQWRNS